MNLSGKQPTFRRRQATDNPNRIIIWLVLLIPAIFLLRATLQKQIKSPFDPTPIPTRISASFEMEGATDFTAGDLNKAIEAYQNAVKLDPKNVDILSELARIQVYSSASLSTDAQKITRFKDALTSINKAVELAPDDSKAHAVKALVLDWDANPALVGDQWQTLLTDAEQEATRALALDNKNTLALAYYAEVLVDEQKLVQAEQTINQALAQDPSLMDVHRVHGWVRESLGYYGDAITAYQEAAKITPNLTFLYINIGKNYRQLKQYDHALEYFAKAANINTQLNVNDPTPYLEIGRTYAQMGEFFNASRNVEKVLQIDPTNPDIYGKLGVIYFQARNYEGSIPVLKCATVGCSAKESSDVLGTIGSQTVNAVDIPATPLTLSTVVYYYTYGSVLAGMARPYNNDCDQAMVVLEQVRASFSTDSSIMQIVQTSENICTSMKTTPSVTPNGTPKVTPKVTPTLTRTP